MKILIVEDGDTKYSRVERVVSDYFKGNIREIRRATDLSSATREIYERKFDLIVTDLLLPPRTGDSEVDLSDEIASTIQDSDNNRATSVIALSAFTDIVEERRRYFIELGVFIVSYIDSDDSWIKPFELCLQRVEVRTRYDLLIFCALEKERTAYKAASCKFGDSFVARGLNCAVLEIEGRKGLCIKMPRPGLVDAAIIAARAIDLYSPKFVGISGICAGVQGGTNIGALVVGSLTWEYQAGKFYVDNFRAEPYQVVASPAITNIVDLLIEQDKVGKHYKDNTFSSAKYLYQETVLGPVASGSAVIADPQKVVHISEQQRKMAAIDMEMHSVYRACEISPDKPLFLGAKTVVDLADENKGDEHHVNGAIISARFMTHVIRDVLSVAS